MLLIALLGCGTSPQSEDEVQATLGKPVVVATSYPVYAMAEAAAGETIDLQLVAPDGWTAVDWMPSRSELATLQSADLILLTGAGWEPWRSIISLPESRVFDTSICLQPQLRRLSGVATHQHGPDGNKVEGGVAHGSWLDPRHATVRANAIARRLADIETSGPRPEFDAFIRDLESTASQLLKLTAEEERSLMVGIDGPYYEYLTATFSRWIIESRESSDIQLRFRSSNPESLPEDVVEIDLCVKNSTNESFAVRLQSNVQKIADALSAVTELPPK